MCSAAPADQRLIIRNVRVFDGVRDQLSDPSDVLIEGDRVVDAASSPVGDDTSKQTTEIDGGGRVLMPGMSDAHVHLMGNGNTLANFFAGPTGLLYANTLTEAKRVLLRGFTTVRDMGGDTVPIKTAIDQGNFDGPRIFPSQTLISQTAGHGDFSMVYQGPKAFGGGPSRTEEVGFTRVADGVTGVLTAVRENLRGGASQIKLAIGGGAASMYDPLNTLQFTPEELRAAVNAAEDYGTYVSTHVYTSAGIRRAIDAGVRSIEHGHLADEEAVALIGRKGLWLSTQPFHEADHHYDIPAQAEKNAEISAGTDQLYTWAKKHGVKVAWGTDLLFEPDAGPRESEMAARLGEHFTNFEALRILTSGNAELLELAGPRNPYGDAKLGVLEKGSWADALLVDGDPLTDLQLLADPDANLKLIIKSGKVVKNTL